MRRTDPTRRRNSRRDNAAVHMEFRQQLFDLVREIIERDQLADYQLGKAINVARTRASALIHGHIRLFNSETLVDILARLGVTVAVTVVERRPYVRGFVKNPRPGWKPLPGAALW